MIISGLKETFIKRAQREIYSWKDHQGRINTGRTEWESRELSEEFMEWNTVERARKTEIDTRTEEKGAGKLGWFMFRNKPQNPHHVKVSPRGRDRERYRERYSERMETNTTESDSDRTQLLFTMNSEHLYLNSVYSTYTERRLHDPRQHTTEVYLTKPTVSFEDRDNRRHGAER